ncbi:hypothetical protein GDO81_008804 [Engystomops pustulosus]|nr:hypothetical protein GDO81_008804 [Engystomops pustulosus]
MCPYTAILFVASVRYCPGELCNITFACFSSSRTVKYQFKFQYCSWTGGVSSHWFVYRGQGLWSSVRICPQKLQSLNKNPSFHSPAATNFGTNGV